MGVNSIQTNIMAAGQESFGDPALSKAAELIRAQRGAIKPQASPPKANTDYLAVIKEVKEERRISPEEVKDAVAKLNHIASSLEKKLSFFIDEPTGRFGVKVIDKETNKVIRQIPPEELLALSAKIHEMVGMLIDERS